MAQYEEHNQLDYRQGGDTVDDFARKYMAETTRIFRFLNDLRSNTTNSIEYTEPVAGQLKVEDNKLYIRNESNDAWVLLGSVDTNFGFKPADAEFITDADIATEMNQPNKVYKTDENGILPVSIGGNAAKLAGINVNTDIIEDGQVLTYRAATNSWHNEPKGVIGSGKALNLYDGETLLCSYAGDTSQDFDLGITANKQYAEDKADEAKEYADKKADEGVAYAKALVNNKADKTDIATHNADANAHADIRDALNHISGIPTGMVLAFTGNGDIPEGFLLCDGASVPRAMYPDLFAVIGTDYGAVDETHFNLPNLIDEFIQYGNVAGIKKEAGLPNIEGRFEASTAAPNYVLSDASGAFAGTGGTGQANSSGGTASTTRLKALTFDASRSNPIYGNSTTVQPPSLTARPIIKAFDGQTADSSLIDVTQYAQELANKVNRSEADYVVDSYRDDDGNWYRVYKSGWIEQGGIIPIGGSVPVTITLLKPFSNTNYFATRNINVIRIDINAQYGYISIEKMSASVIKTYNNTDYIGDWYACGQGADI